MIFPPTSPTAPSEYVLAVPFLSYLPVFVAHSSILCYLLLFSVQLITGWPDLLIWFQLPFLWWWLIYLLLQPWWLLFHPLLSDLLSWMYYHQPKLNMQKTKLLLFPPKPSLFPSSSTDVNKLPFFLSLRLTMLAWLLSTLPYSSPCTIRESWNLTGSFSTTYWNLPLLLCAYR